MPPPLDLHVDHDQEQASTIVHVGGEVDLATAGRLRGQLQRAAGCRRRPPHPGSHPGTFIDSVGLSVLVGAYRALGGRGGRVRLVATDRAVLATV